MKKNNTNTFKLNFESDYNIELDVLDELDRAFNGIKGKYFPESKPGRYIYNFFVDIEDGYLYVANCIIHLYAKDNLWAIVFETNGYHTRQHRGKIDLIYVGNCINYSYQGNENHHYISNSESISIISSDEFQRIENKKGTEMEQFELIGEEIVKVLVRDEYVQIEKDKLKYKEKSIEFRDYDNSEDLIGFEDLIRYLSDIKNPLIIAREHEILKMLPTQLEKLMTIDKFYQKSNYEDSNSPSNYDTYQMIAKILSTKDVSFWKEQKNANNHWTNWESGTL